MRDMRNTGPRSAAVLFAIGLLSMTGAAEAAANVHVRELSMSKELRATEQSVRASLDAEAKRVSRQAKSDAILSVVITKRAQPSKEGRAGAIEVVVSAAVRDARSGSLLGMVEGRAATMSAPRSDQAMVEQAATGAFKRLPSMLGVGAPAAAR